MPSAAPPTAPSTRPNRTSSAIFIGAVSSVADVPKLRVVAARPGGVQRGDEDQGNVIAGCSEAPDPRCAVAHQGNLEVPRCAIAHLRFARSLSSGAHSLDPLVRTRWRPG